MGDPLLPSGRRNSRAVASEMQLGNRLFGSNDRPRKADSQFTIEGPPRTPLGPNPGRTRPSDEGFFGLAQWAPPCHLDVLMAYALRTL
jgi:hypothetical protein